MRWSQQYGCGGESEFQSFGAAWEKALAPIVLSLMVGSTSNPAVDDQSEREGV